MNTFETYQIYQSLKLHFNSNDYDYFKYKGKTKSNYSSFSNSKEKFLFEKLRRNFRKKEDFELYCVSNFICDNTYIRNFDTEVYWSHKKILESMEYTFKKDLTELKNCATFKDTLLVKEGKHPLILKKLLSDDISIETFIILNEILKFYKYFDNNIKEDYIWKEVKKKCNSLKPFIMRYIDIKHYAKIGKKKFSS